MTDQTRSSRARTATPKAAGGRARTATPKAAGGRARTATPKAAGGRARTAAPKAAGGRSGSAAPEPEASLVRRRAAARAIDTAVVGVPALVVGTVSAQTLTVGFVVGVLLVAYLYETAAVAIFGASLGKASMGLGVVDAETGGRPAVSRAGTRFLFVAAVAGAIHLVAPVGPAVAVFLWGSAVRAPQGRGLPDKVAATRVVDRG